jgi:hypothetical protein
LQGQAFPGNQAARPRDCIFAARDRKPGRPEFRSELERLRRVHERWMKETGDLGLIPEEELDERVRPGGRWSQTAAPIITPSGPAKMRITCPTEGGSIAYTTETGAKPRWKLYSGELTLTASARLRAIACRLATKTARKSPQDFKSASVLW